MKRSKQIRANVQRVLGNRGETFEGGLSLAIYEAGDRVQRRIAGETLCLEGFETIHTQEGEELYGFPEGMIAERKLIPQSGNELVRIGMDRVDALKRGRAGSEVSDSSTSTPFYYYRWGNQFGFLSASGGGVGDSEISNYYFRYPDDSDKMSDTRDPAVPVNWDTAIFYGILAEMTGEPRWVTQYETEFERQANREKSTRAESMAIQPTGDYD
jgi:hypothetical protein